MLLRNRYYDGYLCGCPYAHSYFCPRHSKIIFLGEEGLTLREKQVQKYEKDPAANFLPQKKSSLLSIGLLYYLEKEPQYVRNYSLVRFNINKGNLAVA